MRQAPLRPSMTKNDNDEEMVNDEVGDVVAGMDLESGIEEELFGDVADTEASGAEMGSGRRAEAHEDNAEEHCGPKRLSPGL